MKSQKGLYSHWQRIYQHQEFDFRAASLRLLITSLLKKGERVLDIGCGAGGQALFLARLGYGVTGIDESAEMLNMAKEQAMDQGLMNADFYHISLNAFTERGGSYLQIVCLDVLEHIENDEGALIAINSLLTNEGRLVLTVPAHQYLYGPRDKKLGHYRRYSKSSLINKMELAGFTIDKIRYWNFIGYLVTLVTLKLFHAGVNDDFRKTRGGVSRIIQAVLKRWFIYIENKMLFPVGLSLLVVARKVK